MSFYRHFGDRAKRQTGYTSIDRAEKPKRQTKKKSVVGRYSPEIKFLAKGNYPHQSIFI